MIDNFLTNILKQTYGADLVKSIQAAVNFDPEMFTNIIEKTSHMILPIASVLVVIYFMMQLMDKITTEQFTTDQFIKMLIKLVVAIVIITNISTWSMYIMQFGALFTTAVTYTTSATITYEIGESINQLHGMEKFFTVTLMMIPWLVSMLLRVAIYVLGYGRTIEVGLRSCLSPIGCADMVTGGVNSNGFKYIKKMVAVSMQGGIMILVATVGAALVNRDIANINNLFDIVTIAKYLGITASMVGIMAASKQLSYELVGA